jgi:hypothetical protein
MRGSPDRSRTRAGMDRAPRSRACTSQRPDRCARTTGDTGPCRRQAGRPSHLLNKLFGSHRVSKMDGRSRRHPRAQRVLRNEAMCVFERGNGFGPPAWSYVRLAQGEVREIAARINLQCFGRLLNGPLVQLRVCRVAGQDTPSAWMLWPGHAETVPPPGPGRGRRWLPETQGGSAARAPTDRARGSPPPLRESGAPPLASGDPHS